MNVHLITVYLSIAGYTYDIYEYKVQKQRRENCLGLEAGAQHAKPCFSELQSNNGILFLTGT